MMKLKRNEKSKDVSGYEGLYAVTTEGRVWSYRRNKLMSPWTDMYGYSRVTFRKDGFEKDMRLHRLVGEAFIENPELKPQINHISGIKSDCKLVNLQWCTARENLQHASDMGLNKTYKLSYHDKEMICQFHHTFDTSPKKLSELFGVKPSSIRYILRTYSPIVGNA
jgi:hypothetical protein